MTVVGTSANVLALRVHRDLVDGDDVLGELLVAVDVAFVIENVQTAPGISDENHFSVGGHAADRAVLDDFPQITGDPKILENRLQWLALLVHC